MNTRRSFFKRLFGGAAAVVVAPEVVAVAAPIVKPAGMTPEKVAAYYEAMERMINRAEIEAAMSGNILFSGGSPEMSDMFLRRSDPHAIQLGAAHL